MLTLNQLVGFAGGKGPVNVTYIADAFAAASADTVMTFPDVGIGATSLGEYVYVAFTAEGNVGNNTVTSVTIGGIPAARAVSQTSTGATPDLNAQIWYAPVPIETLATIAFNFDVAVTGDMVISTFRVQNVSIPAADFEADLGLATSINIVLDVPAQGGLVVVGGKAGSTVNTTWTGATEDTDVSGGAYGHSAASAEAAVGEVGRTITFAGVSEHRVMAGVAIG